MKGRNSKPTCHFCGKKGHTANVCQRKFINQDVMPKNMTNFHKCNKQGIMHMNAEPRPCIHKDLKDIAMIVRNVAINLLNVDPKPCGDQTSQQR